MERKHNTSDHYQHEHHNSAGVEETHHIKESHGRWVCHRCGWTHPNNPHPSAKQRRNHKKHCGKIEGFNLINSGETEKRGASSEEVSSDEEHKSTDHTEKEGKHITSHQHQHEKQLHPADEKHHTKEHHGWVCHRCGWTYPNPHPSAKHRKNHKRQCGKIEGFKLISSRDKEIQGGSSDDESSDDELTSMDHEKISPLKENNVAAQKNASPPTSECTSRNLDISSSEANVGAIQTQCVSDDATLEPTEPTGIDANARNSIISEDKSDLFYKVIPDTDNSQSSSGSVDHQELPVKGHQLQNPRHIEAPRTIGKSAATPVHAAKEHNIGIGSRRVGIASILSFKETPASADTKIYELSQTNHQAYESKTQEVLVSETKEDKMQHHVATPCAFMDSSTIKHDMKICDPNCKKEDSELASEVIDDENYAKSETCRSEYAVISKEKKNTAEHDMFFKPGDYIEPKNISPSMNEDSDRTREEERPPNFENSNSDDTLHLEEEKEKIINQESTKDPSSEGIESTSGQKLDVHASNVVIPDQETSSTDRFPREDSGEGENQQTECSSISSSNTIEHVMKDYNPDYRMADSTPEDIVLPATDIVRDADTPINEVANENQEAIKGPSSEGVESTSGQKLDEQASNVVILDHETSGIDSFPTEYSKEGEKQQRESSSITSSSTIEHDMKDYNPDCRTADSTPENIIMPATDIVNDADIPVNEVADEKSVAAESHHPESMVHNHEQKSTVEKAISVNPAEYIESKETPNLEKAKVMKEPCSGGIETTLDQKLISQASSKLVISDEAMSSADSPPIEISELGETQQNECNAPLNSSVIEPSVKDSDPDSKNDYSMQGNIMLPDVDRDEHIDANINAQESLSKAAATEVVHANSAGSESVQSNARDTYSSSQDVGHANFGAQFPEKELQYKHHEQGLEHSGVEQSDQFKVDNVNYTSCSATTTIADNSLQLIASSTDGHGDSSKESMDDVHGSKTESLKTCEPALWEQLLESNAKESDNPEIYQDLGNGQQSPDNPFIHGQNFSNKEEAHQTFHLEGGHALISEQLKNKTAEVESALPLTNNGVEQSPITKFGYKGEGNVEALNLKENTSATDLEAPADMCEAPSFITLVETSNQCERRPSHHEIQPNADLAPGGSQNGELSAEAADSESERLERPHKPLRNLLAEENKRGTQDRSKQDPSLVEQPKTSSQNNIQGVHASTAHVTGQGSTSSLKLEVGQKDSNSSSKKTLEKVWNSPARLPSPKVEKQKVKVKSAWSMCLCGSAAN